MSVKVAIRLRPFNERELKNQDKPCIDINQQTVRIKNPNKKERTFTFDNSFWSMKTPNPNADPSFADQEVVYNKIGSQMVEQVFKGLNCCLFAYGQTGSGKSYSMMGSENEKGVIPRLILSLFERIEDDSMEDKEITVEFSMLEIYNEKIQDLLVDVKKRKEDGMKLRLNTEKKCFYVHELNWKQVGSFEEVQTLLDLGNRNRSVAATQMNATSSRAHTLVTLKVEMKEEIRGNIVKRTSEINLVDLAGSEKVGKTGVRGKHLKEGCHINKSLTSLGRVITILAEKAQGKSKNVVIPYRESALTMILKNALGGNSMTYMLCTLSPAISNYEESLSTLHYANQAKRIKCHAVVNESKADREIRLLKEENEKLRLEIKNMKEERRSKLSPSKKKIISEEPSPLTKKSDSDDKLNTLIDKFERSEFKLQSITKNNVLERKLFRSDIMSVKSNKPNKQGFAALININEDPMLNAKYELNLEKMREVIITNKTNWVNWKDNMIMCDSPGIKKNHAFILYHNEKVFLKVNPNQTKREREAIMINGKTLFGGRNELKHEDIIIIGKKKVFIYREKGRGIGNLPDYDSCLLSARTRTRTIIETIETMESGEFESLQEQEALKREKINKLEMSLTRRNNIISEKDKRIKELEQKLKQIEYDEDEKESKHLIETGNHKSHRGLFMSNSMVGKNVEKKIKKMNEILKKRGRNIKLSPVENPVGSGIYRIRVDNFDAGYAYVWDMEELNERYSKCMRQKKMSLKGSKGLKLNTSADPFWSKMDYVFLGKSILTISKGKNFFGDLHLKHTKPKGFSVMIQLQAEDRNMHVKVGKMQNGWVKIIKYYIKIECFKNGEGHLKKLRSDNFDFPKKEETERNDFFEHQFEHIFAGEFDTNDGEKKKDSYKLEIKAYGVIAAEHIFGNKKLFESMDDWNQEESLKREVQLLLGQNTVDHSFDKTMMNTSYNKTLNDDKPCCVIF